MACFIKRHIYVIRWALQQNELHVLSAISYYSLVRPKHGLIVTQLYLSKLSTNLSANAVSELMLSFAFRKKMFYRAIFVIDFGFCVLLVLKLIFVHL